MSLPLFTVDNFTGSLRLGINSDTQEQFEQYITDYTRKYIVKILSEKAFIDITDQEPLQQKYIDLLDGVNWIDSLGIERSNIGFSECLKRFIWAEFCKDNFTNTSSGNVMTSNENSLLASEQINTRIIRSRYNEAIQLYRKDIVDFICEYSEVITDITGFSIISSGIVEILTASTKYLYDGDKIIYNGVEYVVSDLVENTSFRIATEETNIVGEYYYSPFYEYKLPNLDIIWL